ncbi:MAG: hypothetical protein ACI8Y4_005652 [Candidatus Poriferisodalaceae bacterium]
MSAGTKKSNLDERQADAQRFGDFFVVETFELTQHHDVAREFIESGEGDLGSS